LQPPAINPQELLAAVRCKILAAVFVKNGDHQAIIMEHVRSVIVAEMLDSVADGFQSRRAVRRERSVGGESEVSHAPSQSQCVDDVSFGPAAPDSVARLDDSAEPVSITRRQRKRARAPSTSESSSASSTTP
jgi:hypothetical protein